MKLKSKHEGFDRRWSCGIQSNRILVSGASKVFAEVETKVYNQVWRQVRCHVYGQVWSQVRGPVNET